MSLASPSPCSIPFLDCRSYYDLVSEIISAILACIILFRAMGNYKQLRMQKYMTDDKEYIQNLNQKLKINKLNIAFLLLFIAHLLFSMAIFQIINESKREEQISNIISGHFEYWYKFSNLLMVEMLNCLVVAIGWLYWKTLNCFYKIKGLKIPTIYNNKVKYGVWTALSCMVAIPCVSLAEVVLSDFEIDRVLNWTVLGSTIIATTFFVSFRLIYFRNIFSSVKMSPKAVRREHIHNTIITIASLGRVSLCMLNAFKVSFQDLREYETVYCHDRLPYHAILVMIIRLVIDLVPALIFTRIFAALERKRMTRDGVDQTLFSAMNTESSGM